MKGRPFGWFRLAWQKILLAVTDDTVDPAESSFSFDDYDITANSSSTATGSIVARNAAGDPLSGKTAVLAIETIAVSAANGIVTATAEIADDGTDRAYVTVTVKDASGRGIPDIPAADVVIAVSGTGNTVTQPTGSTNQAGVISTGYFVSTVAATKTVSATVRSTAITDTASTVVTGTPAAGAFDNEPVGFTMVADWNDGATLTDGGFAPESGSTPFRSLSASSGSLGSITTTTTAIVAAAGSWVTAGLIDPASEADPATANWPQYIRLASQDAGNNGRWCLIDSISGTTLNVTPIDGSPLVANAVPDADWTATAGWGEYSVVASGYTGTPDLGGANVMQRFYPAGVDGGHDAGRIVCTLDDTKDEVFIGAELQYAADSTVSTSGGGNKQVFVTTATERLFSNFSSAESWNIYVQSTLRAAGSVALTTGAWIKHELYVRKPTGADNDGIMRLWIDGVLSAEKTDCSVGGGTFPTGDFATVYLDMSNNGNRYPTGSDPRRIGVSSGAAADSTAWCARLYVSQPT